MILSGMVALECLAAVLFVSDFLSEQIEAIQMNCTLVETYQRTHGERTTFSDHFCQVFGSRWWAWPVPWIRAPEANYLEEAIPDDADLPIMGDDSESLGIAGEESEALASDIGRPARLERPSTDYVAGETARPRFRYDDKHIKIQGSDFM
eukprot:gnl/TRDRNA2_/TRDRNA2_170762_c0_seq1.p1 gnl/TRDRNA2_/TRDRNA2_170762_c0~~gnl/TRDRNA2_/TRDRNA2_170762_c0_seq1.p1  ORF type:complete len:150 (-),score=19.64 gnl/TRDRNA2_/TRDRNA2_170762_c0_seq1:92-541(-)